MKIATIVGARPQFIKSAVVSRELEKAGHEEVLIHTGQHYDYEMREVFFKELGLEKPKYNLGVKEGYAGRMIGKMLWRLESVLIQEDADVVLVYGDCNTTLAGALVGRKLRKCVVHVEAGLRSYNDVPEEMNRVVSDVVSDVLFCPTQRAWENLIEEGLEHKAHIVGDVMYDVLKENVSKLKRPKYLNYIYFSVHREENTLDAGKLRGYLDVLKDFGEAVVFPCHPRTAKFIKFNKIEIPDNIEVIPPASYIENLSLLNSAVKVVTDSGGVQKEAYMLKRPCVTMRSITEWEETLKGNWNILSSSKESLLKALKVVPLDSEYNVNIFGDGKASEKIVKVLNEYKLER